MVEVRMSSTGWINNDDGVTAEYIYEWPLEPVAVFDDHDEAVSAVKQMVAELGLMDVEQRNDGPFTIEGRRTVENMEEDYQFTILGLVHNKIKN